MTHRNPYSLEMTIRGKRHPRIDACPLGEGRLMSAKTAVSCERPFLCSIFLLAELFQAIDGKSCVDGTAVREGVFVDIEGGVMMDAVDAFVPISST